MSHTVKRVSRGTTAKLSAYTGPAGELIMNTDTKRIIVQTGNGKVALSPIVGGYFVDPVNGSDSNSGFSFDAAFKTIAKATEMAKQSANSNGYPVIHLAAGDYGSEDIGIWGERVDFSLHGDVVTTGRINARRGGFSIIAKNVNTTSASLTCGEITILDSTEVFFDGSLTKLNCKAVDAENNSAMVCNCPYDITSVGRPITIVYNSLFMTAAGGAACSVTSTGGSSTAIYLYASTAYFANQSLTVAGGNSWIQAIASSVTAYSGCTITASGNAQLTLRSAYFSISGTLICGSISTYTSYFVSTGTLTLAGRIAAQRGTAFELTGTTTITTPSSAAIACSHSSTGLIGGTVSVTISNSDVVFASYYASHISFIANSQITVDGSINTTDSKCGVVAAVNNSSVYAESSATFSGSVTGRRYTAYNGGQIYVGNAGPNKFPGTIAGSVAANSFGYYGNNGF